MRILVLSNADVGLYKFRLELLAKLLEQHHELILSLPQGQHVPTLTAMGCRYIETPLDRRGTNPLSELRLYITYKKLIRQVSPDVVLTFTVKPNVYGGLRCRFMKVPYIANITGLGASIEKGGLLQKLMLILYRAAMKRADCVFFQNQENMDFMIKNAVITHQKHPLIPGSGVNTDKFSLLEYPDDSTVQFLFIGRIMAEKGIEEYIEAAEAITKKYPGTVFHVLGACEEAYEAHLHALTEQGVIVYHGETADVREFHKFAHCTVHPSYWEGMSNVLLESAACGRPVLASDISGCKESVDDGKTGFLFERKSAKALIHAIERFLALSYTEKAEMGLAGRAKMEKLFDRKIVVEAYVAALKEISVPNC